MKEKKDKKCEFDLVVTTSFFDYKRGDLITEKSKIDEISNGAYAHNTVKILKKRGE